MSADHDDLVTETPSGEQVIMKVYTAPEEIELPVLSGYSSADIDAHNAACEKYIADVQEWARKNGEPHKLSGERVSVPYADSSAEYVIVKLRGRVSLIHIATWDAWRSPELENTTVSYLASLVERARAFSRA